MDFLPTDPTEAEDIKDVEEFKKISGLVIVNHESDEFPNIDAKIYNHALSGEELY